MTWCIYTGLLSNSHPSITTTKNIVCSLNSFPLWALLFANLAAALGYKTVVPTLQKWFIGCEVLGSFSENVRGMFVFHTGPSGMVKINGDSWQQGVVLVERTKRQEGRIQETKRWWWKEASLKLQSHNFLNHTPVPSSKTNYCFREVRTPWMLFSIYTGMKPRWYIVSVLHICMFDSSICGVKAQYLCWIYLPVVNHSSFFSNWALLDLLFPSKPANFNWPC